MTHPVHIVVVAYHAADQLDRCLAALGDEVEVTVVDNSSSAAVHAVALRHGAAWLDAGRNIGFGAGVNLELRALVTGPARDVLLLNPDAVIAPPELQVLADFLHLPRNDHVAAVSPRLIGRDGTDERVEWPFPTPWGAWVEAIGFGGRRHGRRTFVIGAVLLLRWDAILEVGLFDERFFLYAEETDWQRRALAFGWRSAVCNDAVATHLGAGTSQDPRRRETLFHAGQETYVRKWHGSAGWVVYRSASCVGAAGRAVLLTGERRSAAARRAHLYLRGPRRCAQPLRE